MKRFPRSVVVGMAAVLLSKCTAAPAYAADPCDRYRATLTREAQAVFGLGAPVPALAAQLLKESSCRADVTAWDNGRGLAQFMDPTAAQVARIFPELGVPDPYNPTWSIRAQVRFNNWMLARVQGDSECERWGAAFKGYNAGLGYVQRAQRQSRAPGVWFGVTEDINAGQSAGNFSYSRQYPRTILFAHQLRYLTWGVPLCTRSPR
jgi:soluble lytic murein transglycosylase-like protein